LTGNIKENYKKYNKERQYGSTLDASETPALTKEFNKPASTPGASILKKGSKGSKV
jgi:ribosomal protein L14E/L6E/L27E